MPNASLTIDGRQIEDPTAIPEQRFSGMGQELDVQSFIDEGDAMRAAQPPQQAHAQQQPQEPIDPLAWWQGSPDPSAGGVDGDPQVKQWQNNFYNEFAQGFHQQEFNSLADYERWVKSRRTAGPVIDGFIRKTAMQYMPRKIREEYEQQSAMRKAENQFKRSIDLQGQMASKIQDAVAAGDLPEGVFFDPKTNGINYKAPKKADPAKERNAIISQLGKLRSYKQQADLDGSEEESAIYAEEIQNMISQLRGGGQSQVDPEQLQAYAETLPPDSQDRGAIQFVLDNPDDPRVPAIMQILQANAQQ